MLSNEKQMDKLTIVSRMLAYQQQQNETLEQSFKQLRKTLSPSYSNSIDELEAFTQGKIATLRRYQHGPFQLMTILLEKASHHKANTAKLLINTHHILKDTISDIKEQAEGFNSLIFYLAIVMFLVLLTFSIVTVKVLPEFAEAYNNADAALPALTEFVVNHSGFFKAAIFFILLFMVSLIGLMYHIKHQILLLLPLFSSFRSIPIINHLYHTYHYFLFVHYIKLLEGSELSSSLRIDIARELSQYNSEKSLSSWEDALLMAIELSAFNQENEYQCQQIKAVFNRHLLRTRETINLIIQLSLAIIVALLAASIYLPIFSLGTVI